MIAQELLQRAAAEQRLGRIKAAEQLCRQVLASEPDNVEGLHLLGALALQTGRHTRAEPLLAKAVRLDPDRAQVHVHFGMALEGVGKLNEAVEAYKRAMGVDPDLAEPYVRFGTLLKDNGQLQEAGACFAEALRRERDDFNALAGLSGVLLMQGRPAEAFDLAERAVALRPDSANALFNLADALHDLDRIEEAGEQYEHLLTLHPGNERVLNNLAVIRRDQGRIGEAVDLFRRATDINPAFVAARSNAILTRHYLPDAPRKSFLEHAKAFGAEVADPLTKRARPHPGPFDLDKPLRIGVLSGDFRVHAVSSFLLPLLLELHVHLDVTCYCNNPFSDSITKTYQKVCRKWRDISGLGDQEAAELIRADSIDVLIDASGHSAHNRALVLARKPAPVQAVWLGWFDTTGMEAMDYLLADPHVAPAGEEQWYTEGLYRLPGTFWCYTPPDVEVEPVEAPFMKRKIVTFGCFNNTAKINEQVVESWVEILRGVQGSELILQSKSFGDPAVRARYLDMFVSRGGDKRQVVFRPAMIYRDYLACYQEIDIALDPFPYSGGATSADALWMGVPVVTLAGERFVSRMTASLLSNAGLGELVAQDRRGYVELAVALATDPGWLPAVRDGLRERFENSPACNAKQFARQFAEACRDMWRAHCEGQA